ncbi:MAG TPA: ABC transporter substrate-binding protein [Longimicrobiaceae bacterium]|nr:ABC transporter substrate-binding protein [Longimicrobiaceae bacterium]
MRWRTAAVTVLALAAGACGGGNGGDDKEAGGRSAADEAPDRDYGTFGGGPPGGTLVVLWEGEPDNLNPITYDANPAYQVVHLVFRALGRRDSTLSRYEPDFLERWEQRDPNTVVLHVRPGIRWHDGVPTSARDIVFTLERQKDEAVASTRAGDVEAVESVRMLDSMSVEVRLSRTGPATLNSLLEVVPAPAHLLDSIPPGRLRFAAFNSRPVGNGLFRFERWDKGQQVVVVANPDAPRPPSLQRIVVRVVPDASARLTGLLNNEGDLLKPSAEQVAQIRNSSNVALHSAAKVRPAWIAWNVTKAPVNDVRVRRAFLMAINRPQLATAMFGTDSAAALSPLAPRLWEHGADVRPIPYDPAGAQRLLQEAGWVDTNGDGVREKGGQPLRLEVEYSSADPVRADALVFMQQEVRKVGIDLAPRPYERTTWVSRLRARDFVGSFWGWGWGPGVVGPNAKMIFHSGSIPPNGPNFAGYRNPQVDQLIDAVIVEGDSGRARAAWRQIEQALIDDAVYAPIFLDPEFYAANARFRNVRFRGPEWWEDVIYWWIPEDQRLPRDRQPAQ